MNPIQLNFINILRRFKLAAILNILGLSVAFTAFMVIMIQLDYDWSFDKFHKESEKIFRLEFTQQNETWATVSRPLAERFFESSPHIVSGAISDPPSVGERFFYVDNNGSRDYYKEKSIRVSPEFADVFTFDFVEGTKDALNTPRNIIIPLSLSRKLFGNKLAVGQQLVFDLEKSETVGAVYRDFPANSVIDNYIYIPNPRQREADRREWRDFGFIAYIRVNDALNAYSLVDNFKRDFDIKAVLGESFDWNEVGINMRLTALPDIHFLTDVQYDEAPKASKQMLLILLLIAVVIVVIAAINFTNFSTALSPMRINSINTQKVLGAMQYTLRLSLVFEAIFISFLAYFISFGFFVLFKQMPLATLVDGDLSLTAHPLIAGCTAMVALLTGFLAGFYPARYITTFAPALVLNGNFGLSQKGKRMRDALICVQFTVSFALIIGASFMYLQNHFMQNSPLGYNKDTLITVDIERIEGNRDAFTEQIKMYSGIEDVTYAEYLFNGFIKWGRKYKGEDIMYQVIPVHYTFLNVMGIEVTQGRGFRQDDMNLQRGAYVFNEKARNQYNLELNTTIDNHGEIVGFMSDVKIAPFSMAVEPMAFYVFGRGSQPTIACIQLKKGTNVGAAISYIRTTLSEFEAGYPFDVRLFDQILQRVYKKERSLSTLFSLFSLIAIFISIVGVFGLVMFDSECRRKEIGIRKIYGSSVIDILIMFNKAYFRILLICYVVASPLAWYAVYRWLQNFAYKTPMYWWVYLLAFMVIGIITTSTVTFQNWRVANDNPIK